MVERVREGGAFGWADRERTLLVQEGARVAQEIVDGRVYSVAVQRLWRLRRTHMVPRGVQLYIFDKGPPSTYIIRYSKH